MLYRCFALFFVISLFTGCSTTPKPPSEPLRLRVLTYNIHHGRGTDGVIDLQRLADIIMRAKPDLVALQEVDVKTKRTGGVDQAAKLGELTGMHHTFAEAMPFQGGGYGNAVLSRVPTEYTFDHNLPNQPGHEPRSVAKAALSPWIQNKQTIWFASAHLCHKSSKSRAEQVRSIVTGKGYTGWPTVLVGDFNFMPDSEPYKAMIDAGWVDTAAAFGDPKPTCPADKPTMRIDYVFVRPAERWRVINVQVLDEPIASDHAPVLVELEYLWP